MLIHLKKRIRAMKVTFFATSSEFRTWLAKRHQDCVELWVGFYKKSSGKPSLTYPEAVDQTLCFGWIDGVRKSVTEDAYTVRFTPRKAKSQWSAVNIRHVQRLTDAGHMHPAGLKAFQGAQDQSRKYSYEQRQDAVFEAAAQRRFESHKKAWDFFQAQAPWYRRTATFWVISAKQEHTRQKRLGILIADCARGQPIKPLAQATVPKRQKTTRVELR
jgi:uncharacterized protein YdeI (YjbR/CyaY-like superfamily)